MTLVFPQMVPTVVLPELHGKALPSFCCANRPAARTQRLATTIEKICNNYFVMITCRISFCTLLWMLLVVQQSWP